MNNTYPLLQSPISKKPLTLKINEKGLEILITENESYPIIENDIPVFFSPENIEGLNEKYMTFYNKIAFLYRLSAHFSTKKEWKNY